MLALRSILLLLLGIVPGVAQQKKPPEKKEIAKVLYSVPLVAPTGKKSKFYLYGTGIENLSEVKVASGKGTIKIINKGKPAGIPNNYPANKLGNTECEIEVDLPNDATGPLSLVLVSPAGTSEPYSLHVAAEIIAEKEPNDSFKQAMPIASRKPIWGMFQKERDVDVYTFSGNQNQKVHIEVLAAKYGAPTDVILTIYDSEYRTLKIIDDVAGQADPSADIVLPRDGNYFIGLQEANDLGSNRYSYQLKVNIGD